MNNITIFIRIEASKKIGYGHLMRTSVLAEELQSRGWPIIFLCNNDPSLLQLLEKKSFSYKILKNKAGSVRDQKDVTDILYESPGNIFIHDNYGITFNYERAVKPFTQLLVAFDDEANRGFLADIIINQNYGAESLQYTLKNKETKILAGSRYVLLRDEFISKRKMRGPKRIRELLLIFGGSDTQGMTFKMLKALNEAAFERNLILNCTAGKNYKGFRKISRLSRIHDHINLHLNVKSMPELMGKMDMAISASGSTVWELLYMGIPSLLIITAENQKMIARNLDKDGYAVNLGWYDKLSGPMIVKEVTTLILDQKKQDRFIRKGRKLIDGKGRARIAQEIIRAIKIR